VAVKAALAGVIMALVYGSAAYLLLGVAVAQIDPVSVAAMMRHSGMSERAKSVMAAWASFDDPVTVLLVVYLMAFVLAGSARSGGLAGASAASYVAQIIGNAAIIGAAALLWRLAGTHRPWRSARAQTGVQSAILVGLLAVSATFGLLIGITVIGLFFRPAIDAILSRAVDVAFYGATFLVGAFLITGVHIAAGIILGVIVFGAQGLAGLAISRGMSYADRGHLAFGQQNGITAIILALALQPSLRSAVGIIAVAILVVNSLNIVTNGLWDRHLARREAARVPASVPPPWSAPEGSRAGVRASR
jgi:NhaP-type Na+/H+ or K+/H+ antiporter